MVRPSRLIQQMKPLVYLSHLVPSVGHGKAVYLGFLTLTGCIFCYTQSSAMKWWKYRWYLSSEQFCIWCFILILLLWASRMSFIMAVDQFLSLCKILGILKDFLVLIQLHRFFLWLMNEYDILDKSTEYCWNKSLSRLLSYTRKKMQSLL